MLLLRRGYRRHCSCWGEDSKHGAVAAELQAVVQVADGKSVAGSE